MYELHENEQYFFAPDTLSRLSSFLARYYRVCVLCAPRLGQEIAAAGQKVRILDIDDRFAGVPGFKRWDIHRPQPPGEAFDVIVCDPPFFNVSLSRLFRAIRVLAQYRLDQPLLVSYLRRRSSAILGTFHPFGLEPTGFRPTYVTVQRNERNNIEFFGNLGSAVQDELARGCKPLDAP